MNFDPAWVLAALGIGGLVGQHYMTLGMVRTHQQTLDRIATEMTNMRHEFNTRISRIEGRLGVPVDTPKPAA